MMRIMEDLEDGRSPAIVILLETKQERFDLVAALDAAIEGKSLSKKSRAYKLAFKLTEEMPQ